MATMIFIEQENGDVAANMMSKGLVRMPSTKGLAVKGQTLFAGKVSSSNENVAKPSRKALGNVNIQVPSHKMKQSGTVHLKKRQPAKKISDVKIPTKPLKESYPEIENFFPYNPSDFERFDVPEDHKLSHLCLAGVPLLVHEHEAARFEEITKYQPVPMEMPSLSWELDADVPLPSFLATLDEITLDMPDII
ncbi:securin [Pelodytes ibericus]